MSYQRFTFLGILGAVALAIGCASILGIEDAECDPSYPDCAQGSSSLGAMQMTPSLLPGNGGGAGATGAASGASGAGGSANSSGSATSSGTGGGQGGGAAVGSAGATTGASAGAAGSTTMEVDPVVQRASALCLDYCDTVMASCAGMNQQYASQTACLLVCELLDPGLPGATTGNSVSCRLSRAELAATTGEASNYCYTAGPGGGDVCGTDCDGYCTLMTAKCRELGSFNQCLAACSIVPNLSLPPNPQFYNITMQEGDSLQCRLFHVTASTLDPVNHCAHAAGNMPCL